MFEYMLAEAVALFEETMAALFCGVGPPYGGEFSFPSI
jgi:hypothetical protein